MKVLIACEESQAVCKAFRKLGYEAYSCDVIECSGGYPEFHIQGDCLPLINGNCTFTTLGGVTERIEGKWDILIAHPPCTFLSNAGACRLYPHKGELDVNRYQKGLEAKEFFLKLLNADCPHVAVENPVSCKIFNMPLHTQEIQPYQFGHPYTKKTRLWLKNLPPLKPTEIVEVISPYCPAGTGRKNHSKYGAAKRGEDAKNRAKTFPGIAEAMAVQWSAYVEEEVKRMNKKQLRSVMVLHDDTNQTRAEYLGITDSTLSMKMNETNGAEFTQGEIQKIIDRYNLSAEQTMLIFFN